MKKSFLGNYLLFYGNNQRIGKWGPGTNRVATQIITPYEPVPLEVIETVKLNLGHIHTASIIGVGDPVCKIILVIVASYTIR